jgi:endonuclease/exonuclease/phosphatase family metal-dependent hydrolase
MIVGPIFRLAAKIATYLLYAVTILAAYSGRLNPDFFSYSSLLVLLLPYLAVASMVVSLIWIFSKRLITGGIGIAVIAAAWSPISTAVPVGHSKEPDAGAKTITVMSYNIIHGWDQTQNVANPMDQIGNPAFAYVLNSGADIVCLQEVTKYEDWEVPNLTQEFKDSLFKVYPYHEDTTVSDTKVLSKYPIERIPSNEIIKDDRLDVRRYTFYKLNVDGRKLMLVNMHLASALLSEEERNVVTEMTSVDGAKSSISQMKSSIGHKLKESTQKRKIDATLLRDAVADIDCPLIICGDMNDVPESYVYRILRNGGLKDAYVDTGFGPMITYNQHMFWFHLDQIFYRGAIKPLSVEKGDVKYSDHYPLIAKFQFIGLDPAE